MPQGREIEHEAGEAVIEILAEAAVADRGARLPLVAPMMRTRRLLRLRALVAERAVRAELREIEEELLRVGREVQELVEDERSAFANSTSPTRLPAAPENAPRS